MKILLLGGKGESTVLLYNSINQKFPISNVIVEEQVSKTKMVKRRIKRLGVVKVVDQLIFQLIFTRFQKFFSKSRIAQIKEDNNLVNKEIPVTAILNVATVNSKKTISLIKEIQPELILISGTRIISKKVLSCTNAKFINIHVGITPKYRGVHGGYWALAKSDSANCGVTIHQVDEGIDTGQVIAQNLIEITKQDNFTTYPYLQISEGIKLLKRVLEIYNFERKLPIKKIEVSTSNLYYHPTFTDYIYRRLKTGVK